MQDTKYITSDFFEYLEQQKTKISDRVLNAMNYDIMDIIEYNNCFWFEPVSSYSVIPNYVYEYAKKWAKNKGLTYNYDI